ncbi:hypothetical protein Bpfe_022705 [Biomphalaria pfeifferi]|uniref:Uncharacterized protein n=1 Tax=Biomphalaria pfeifferi TaxID=112525 RepID=A0AAD8B4K4_BIOPF|nr:hypothetical protein Bpfe_022705 [Biomphalaria pfeifferi]
MCKDWLSSGKCGTRHFHHRCARTSFHQGSVEQDTFIPDVQGLAFIGEVWEQDTFITDVQGLAFIREVWEQDTFITDVQGLAFIREVCNKTLSSQMCKD